MEGTVQFVRFGFWTLDSGLWTLECGHKSVGWRVLILKLVVSKIRLVVEALCFNGVEARLIRVWCNAKEQATATRENFSTWKQRRRCYYTTTNYQALGQWRPEKTHSDREAKILLLLLLLLLIPPVPRAAVSWCTPSSACTCLSLLG
jgi:hypothetical protein